METSSIENRAARTGLSFLSLYSGIDEAEQFHRCLVGMLWRNRLRWEAFRFVDSRGRLVNRRTGVRVDQNKEGKFLGEKLMIEDDYFAIKIGREQEEVAVVE